MIITQIMSSDDEVEFLSEKNTTKGRHLLEEEVILSSDDECERCREFASITETDTALAMFYLQNNKWDLEVPFFSKWLFSNNFECLI